MPAVQVEEWVYDGQSVRKGKEGRKED